MIAWYCQAQRRTNYAQCRPSNMRACIPLRMTRRRRRRRPARLVPIPARRATTGRGREVTQGRSPFGAEAVGRWSRLNNAAPFASAPLQSLRHYYGLLRPCASLRWSRPRGGTKGRPAELRNAQYPRCAGPAGIPAGLSRRSEQKESQSAANQLIVPVNSRDGDRS
jgi:hypothetical protein